MTALTIPHRGIGSQADDGSPSAVCGKPHGAYFFVAHRAGAIPLAARYTGTDSAEKRHVCLAIPGRIIDVDGDEPILRTGRVDFGGIVKPINLAYVPEARAGDYILAHVGFALTVIDEEEAGRVLDALREAAALEDVP
jgi:hydrogenase expression/formation protein HypC